MRFLNFHETGVSNADSFLSLLEKSSIISWNISGIETNEQNNLINKLSPMPNFHLAFLQEFNADMQTNSFQCASSSVFACPGISARSRSNAIAVASLLVPFVPDQISCPIAMVACLQIGSVTVACLNIHYPMRIIQPSIRNKPTL